MTQKKLTISLLVSGREDTTEKSLDSIMPLLEAVDSELILVDTGCGEEMKQLLQKYTSQIIPFTWCNDFAKARNAGLQKASGEWFMFMDDDERFEDVTPIIEFFQSGRCDEYDQAVYKVRNYADNAGKKYNEEWLSRMIRLEEDTCFKGKVHEVLGPARGKCAQLNAFVHHYGYVNVDSDVLYQKVMRNVPLLQELMEEEPNNLRWRIQLIQEYGSIQKWDNVLEETQKALEFIEKIDKRFINQSRTVFHTARLLALSEMGQKEEVTKLAEEYLKDNRNTNQGNAALCYYGGAAEKYLEYFDAWKQEETSEQEAIIEQSLLFVKDVTTEVQYREMLQKYGVQCVLTGQVETKLSHKRKEQLTKLLHEMLYKNADFFNLPENIWTLADGGVLDIETEWLSLEFSQWEAALQLLKSRGIIALEQAKQRMERYATREDIRYSYFKKEYVSVFMKLESSTEEYEQLVMRFFDFMQGTLEYYFWIYKDEAFAGEMEMLPADAKAAAWLNQMFSREENDWVNKIRDLKECAKVYPALANNVKRLAKLIGEQL